MVLCLFVCVFLYFFRRSLDERCVSVYVFFHHFRVVLCIKHNNYPLINVCFLFVLLSFGALYAVCCVKSFLIVVAVAAVVVVIVSNLLALCVHVPQNFAAAIFLHRYSLNSF